MVFYTHINIELGRNQLHYNRRLLNKFKIKFILNNPRHCSMPVVWLYATVFFVKWPNYAKQSLSYFLFSLNAYLKFLIFIVLQPNVHL